MRQSFGSLGHPHVWAVWTFQRNWMFLLSAKTFLLPSGYQFNKFAQGGASALSGFVTLQTTILGHGPAQVCGLTLDLLLHAFWRHAASQHSGSCALLPQWVK